MGLYNQECQWLSEAIVEQIKVASRVQDDTVVLCCLDALMLWVREESPDELAVELVGALNKAYDEIERREQIALYAELEASEK